MFSLFQRMVAPLLMFGWSVYYFLQFSKQKVDSQYLIRPVFYIVAILFLVISFREFRAWQKEHKSEDGAKSKLSRHEVVVVATLIGGSSAYLFLLPYIGFVLLTPLVLLAAFRYLKAGWLSSCLLSVGLTAFVYVVFDLLLSVPLPSGFLGF